MDMNMDMHSTSSAAPTASASGTQPESPTSYFAYGEHSTTIIAHIALMVLAWCFVLPAGSYFLVMQFGALH